MLAAFSTSFMAIAVAFAAPLVTYLVFVRRTSGRIQTTEATQLWQEASKMREEYREEIARLNAIIDALTKQAQELRDKAEELRKGHEDLKRENARLRAEAALMKERLARLQDAN